ncbi:MAG TPA: Gfo/Idh/MocA family oxidoreductase [Planctomycetota bacterium]|nr:Gfo/Idh/MocA family oxidoreductase [Planctomycetota bacterium]
MAPRGRVALFGLGPWGRNLHRVLSELGELRATWDPDPAAADFAAPDVRATSAEAALADAKVEAVAIASPASTHFELARAALRAGKDVFVEKPLCLDPREGEALVDLADREGRVLMVGHVVVYHPAILALKAEIDAGRLGRVRYVYSNRLNLGVVRPTENILWSFAPHDFAALLHLLGEAPTRVQAVGHSYLKPDRADVTVTHLEFPHGVRGHLFVSWLHPWKEHRLVVIGDRRMATFVDDGQGGALTIHDVGVEQVGDVAVHRRNGGTPVPLPPQEPLRLELAHFLECCDRREEPLTGGRHGAEVVRLLWTADESLRRGGAPLPFVGDPRRPR